MFDASLVPGSWFLVPGFGFLLFLFVRVFRGPAFFVVFRVVRGYSSHPYAEAMKNRTTEYTDEEEQEKTVFYIFG